MNYTVKFQTETKYKSIAYGSGTIYSSGCGPSALCNALANAGIANVSIPTMCALAVSCGARVSGGTVEGTLLATASKKYGFTYKSTSKNADLMTHLKNGGTAICWCGTAYPLFASSSGHFIAAVGVDSIGRVIVADSYWFTGKITYNSVRCAQLRLYNNTAGLVTCNIDALGKATADRSPSYYLISKTSTTSKTTTTTTEKENENDMTYYKLLTDVPSYYKTAIQKLVDSGAMVGTGNGELNISEDLCRMATVLNNAGILDLTAPSVYKAIDDVPVYFRAAVQKLIDRGAISGTGNGELNLSYDICRSLTILDNAHLLDAVTLTDVETGEVKEE
ncbi:MAG: hypothetical protein LUE11_08540 [Clostridia bacterium]|nr:hypothetical protein [Clostridia bacterium]